MENQNQNNIDPNIKELRKVISYTLKELETFKEIGHKRSEVIYAQDALAKEYSKINTEKISIYQNKTNHKVIDEEINQLADILFRNFDIQETSIEILKAYISEYFDRFNKLQKSLTITFLTMEKVLSKISSSTCNKEIKK
ncbi:MAG: hypothetical protein CMP21_06800 [Rickettsiales bacterium]|nr:hypothetical protein [Rickettsiales bacterium]|tara:strand:- start:754 stop:1173 length:420 start_codon:yes stop_codon:yes gene_type:complete